MQSSHVKQANKHSGRTITYVDRDLGTDEYDDPVETVNSTTDISARVKPAEKVTGTDSDSLPWPDVGKLPHDAVLIRVDTDVDADLDDAFDLDLDEDGSDTRYEVWKIQEMYSENGKKIGQKILAKPE